MPGSKLVSHLYVNTAEPWPGSPVLCASLCNLLRGLLVPHRAVLGGEASLALTINWAALTANVFNPLYAKFM